MTKAPRHEVLGIGAAVVDQILFVTDEILKKISGKKGGMEWVDHATFLKILEICNAAPELQTGGSAANTIRGLAYFGRRCAMAGIIGTDEISRYFIDSLKALSITPLYKTTSTPIAQALSLVTPDGERTMRTYAGASIQLTGKDLEPSYFENVDLVHIDGYTLFNPGLTEQAMIFAKEAGAKVSFDLASFEITNMYKKKVIHLLTHYVDVVFANADETRALTQADPERGCDRLLGLCESAVVLMGVKGCWAGCRQEKVRCSAYPVPAIDSTGAGDLFASGFLHGYLSGKSLKECAHYGALAGAAVVQVRGTHIPREQWAEILESL